ncbi:protein pxr1-like [Willisornis vidua]|uniref:Protein pxr1-like n=1 Tax=Willisornis vidua TaxID=1566151 RepID=A0ABQ9D058_9PASS|nr:protein pxr1-like [Willisornis vidua]
MNNSADTKVSGEGGGGGAPGARVEVPLQAVVKNMMRQAVHLQSMEDHRSAEIHLQPLEEIHARAGECNKEAVTLLESHAGSGSCQGPADLWREKSTLEQVFLVGLMALWGHTGTAYT